MLLLGAAVATLLAGMIGLATIPISPIAHHMSVHILLISVVARLVAAGLSEFCNDRFFASGRNLVAATVLQLGVLWALHIPKVLAGTLASETLHIAAQALLLGVAVWFWLAVGAQKQSGWRAIAALLVSGKLVCLLAALLVFAPRVLYPIGFHHGVASDLTDQQLAGLLMIVACPVTYIVAATMAAARMVRFHEPAHESPPLARGS
jgi:putative membrane protein